MFSDLGFLKKSDQGTHRTLCLLLGIVLAVSAVLTANAADLRVPSVYPTIQAAIDAATDGDTVLIADGTYSGTGFTNIGFRDISLTLQSENGSSGCIIDCQHQSKFSDIVNIQTGTLTIDGITVINGISGYEGGCAIRCANSSPVIINCRFFNNGNITNAVEGGAVYLFMSNASFDRCVFENNKVSLNGGAFSVHSSEPVITRSDFIGNEAFRGGAFYLNQSQAVIGGENWSGNFFASNYAPFGSAFYSESGEIHNARFNNFRGPYYTDYYIIPMELFFLGGCGMTIRPIELNVYVSPDGDDSNDGLTPETPYRTIRYALSRISPKFDEPLTIFLSEGVFSIEGSGQTYPLPLVDHVRIVGMGPERTILDGTGECALFLDIKGEDCRLEGLTLMHADRRAVAFDLGELDIKNCVFTENRKEGALRIGDQAEARLEDTVFENNVSTNSTKTGGAIVMNPESDLDALNCTFTANCADSGGALQINNGTALLKNCLFDGNSSDHGGAISTEQACILTLQNCDFNDNSANFYGGALDCQGTLQGDIDDCAFSLNAIPKALSYSMGGALYFGTQNGMENCLVQNSIFWGNSAGFGGAVFVNENCSVTFSTCRFESNRALAGGAIGVTQDGITIGGSIDTGNTFSGNSAGAGADLFSFSRTGDLLNTQFNTFNGNIYSDYYISPISRFDLRNSTGAIEPLASDLYVSPLGDDTNSGLTPEQPVRSLTCALRRMTGTETEPLELHVAPGHYSELDTDEVFPLPCLPWVSIVTPGEGSSIISGNGTDPVWLADKETSVFENMVIRNGCRGFVCLMNTDLTLRDCWIMDNATEGSGGGIWSGWGGTLKLEHSRFERNFAGEDGGAICSSDNRATSDSLKAWNCTFTGNSAANGGAISQCQGGGYVSSSVFYANYAVFGGGYQCNDHVTTVIENCLFTGNASAAGGTALYLQNNSSPLIQYCTITENLGSPESVAILSQASNPVITHSIIWKNAAREIEISGEAGSVTHSIIDGGFEGDGNSDADPLFTCGPMGPYYLSQVSAGQELDSPAVDAGIFNAVTAAIHAPGGFVYLSRFVTRTNHNADDTFVDLGFHYPEAIPPPEPLCRTSGCQIEMPSHYLHGGDDVYCRVAVCNSHSETMTSMPVFVILELAGTYFFAPRFSSFDVYVVDLEPGETVIEVLPPFTWPEVAGAFDDACWYAAVTDRNIAMIMGVLDIFGFGWGE